MDLIKRQFPFIYKIDFWIAMSAGPIVVAILSFVQAPNTTKYVDDINYYWFIISFVFVYPVLEEYVFRGMLQTYLLKKTNKQFPFLSLANIITSLVFSLTHLVYRNPIVGGLVFIPSLVFGYFREKYHSVIPAMLLHVSYNSCYFIGMYLK